MASIQDIISSNEQLHKTHQSMTAVFTGATHGIGLETLRAFLRYIPKPKAIIVGRNKNKFASELDLLRQINWEAEVSFIEADLSLINDIDRAWEMIRSETSPQSIQLLCMSQGYAPIGPRRFNAEGLDEAMTLGVYGRVRLAEKLIAQSTLAPNARVISVLGGGKEGHLFLDDMELKDNYTIMNLRGHFSSMMTLAFDHLAQHNSDMSFVHYYPGTVSTGMRTRIPDSSFLLRFSMSLFTMLLGFVAMTPRESGERTLRVCFGERHERGSFSIGWDEGLGESEDLAEYRREIKVVERVWRHLEELFDKAKGMDS